MSFYQPIFTLTLLFLIPFVNAAECHSVQVTTHPDYPPFHWAEGGKLIGATIDVTGQILDTLGVKWQAAPSGPWKRVLKTAEYGKVDIITGLKRVPEREQYLAYTSTPIYSNPVAIFTRTKDNFSIDQLSDLKPLMGSISFGDRHGEPIDSFVDSQFNMQRIIGLEANFKMMQKGRTQYFILGYYTGQNYLFKNQLEDQFTANKIFYNNVIHVAFSKRSQCLHLLPAFNQELARLKQSGLLTAKLKEYEKLWRDLNKLAVTH